MAIAYSLWCSCIRGVYSSIGRCSNQKSNFKGREIALALAFGQQKPIHMFGIYFGAIRIGSYSGSLLWIHFPILGFCFVFFYFALLHYSVRLSARGHLRKVSSCAEITYIFLGGGQHTYVYANI